METKKVVIVSFELSQPVANKLHKYMKVGDGPPISDDERILDLLRVLKLADEVDEKDSSMIIPVGDKEPEFKKPDLGANVQVLDSDV